MLEATERGLWITGQRINEHATGDDLRRNRAAVLRIRRQDIGLKAISRVIGDRDRFRLVALTRAGQARLVTPTLVGQEGDIMHLAVRTDAVEELRARLGDGREGSHA